MSRGWGRLAAVALVPVLGQGLVACGGEGGEPTALNIEITEPGPGAVQINAPANTAGGTTRIVLKNSGRSAHDAQMIRVEGNRSEGDIRQLFGSEGAPIPDWVTASGGVGRVPPGQTATVTMELEEGNWYIADTVSPDQPDNAPSNVARGGLKPLQVADGGSDASLPDATTTVAARDYTFDIDGELKSGKNSVKFENEGEEPHHLLGIPLLPGKTAADFGTFLQQETGPPPVDFESGVGTAYIGGGQTLVTDFELSSGNYIFVCFVSDRAGGPPHAIGHQMFKEVKVA
jgi:hypothetical protein